VHTVFAGAAVPVPGEAYLDSLPASERLFLRLILRLQKKGPLTPAWAARQSLSNDLDEATTRQVVERLTRKVPRLYSDPVPGQLDADVRSLYVRLAQDKAVSGTTQDPPVARLPGTRVETPETRHLPMSGQPERLAAILSSLA